MIDYTTPESIAQRRAVWEALHQTRHWPVPFEVADADPLVRRIMMLHAIADELNRRRQRDAEAVKLARTGAQRYSYKRPVGLDFKQRASGEREEPGEG